MWIGTSDGLCKLDKKTNKLVTYTEDDGLSNNNIYGILIDNHGNLWMSTNNGISKFDVNEDKFVMNLMEVPIIKIAKVNFYLEVLMD